MVGIDPKNKKYIITFLPKDQRANKTDDKFEIFRSIVGLADIKDILDISRYSGDHMHDKIRKTPRTVTDFNTYELPFIIANLTEDQANKLRKDVNIKYVEEDAQLFKTAEFISWVMPSMSVPPAWDPPLSARGAGVNVAVLDDGIIPHSDLAPNPKVNQSFVVDDSRTFIDDADNTHGLSCGGLIAAKIRNGLGIQGIAPDCNLWNLRISGLGRPEPTPGVPAFVSSAMEALQFTLQNGCHVLSQSHATASFLQAYQDISVACIQQGGMISAASAGNNPVRLTQVYPAAFPGVQGISALNPDNGDLASFSTFGPHVDFTAPGDWGTWSLGRGNGIADFAGTSASCPCFAGAAVVAMSAYKTNACGPPYTPGVRKNDLVLKVLADTATKAGFVGAGPRGSRDERYGWGNPQVDSAVAMLKQVLVA